MLALSRCDFLRLCEPLGREALGGLARRDPGRVGLPVDPGERVADPGDLALEPVGVPAELLEPDSRAARRRR